MEVFLMGINNIWHYYIMGFQLKGSVMQGNDALLILHLGNVTD